MPPQYLTGIDVAVGIVSAPAAFVYPNGLDEQALRASLSALLSHYPVLGGRLRRDDKGLLYVDPGDQGVTFEVWRHDARLPDYGPDRPLDKDLGIYARVIPPWGVVDKPAQSMIEFRLHHFKCGGSLLSLSSIHALCDGAAVGMFMVDWSRLHLGHPISAPMLDRAQLIALSGANVDRPYTQGLLYQPSLPHLVRLGARFTWHHLTRLRKCVVRVSPEQLSAWRALALKEMDAATCPTGYEFTTAHCLQMMSRAIRERGVRHIGLVNDLRFRRLAGVGRKYFGNALAQDMISHDEDFLSNASLHDIALRSRQPLDSVHEDSLLGYLGLLENRRSRRKKLPLMSVAAEHCLGAGIFVNNCAHIPTYKPEFGSGPPSWFETGRTVYRKLMVVSAPPGVGGYDVHITARHEEVEAFRLAS